MRTAFNWSGCMLLVSITIAAMNRDALALNPPFDAVISKADVLVRSGAGGDDSYYATSKLPEGSRIRILREERGGWYVIEPPEGSHCWVNPDHIERRSNNQGIVTQDTFSIIGSEFDVTKYVPVRRRLSKRETVSILGEGTVKSERGSVKMLKIKPPRGEFRYIHMKDVSPDGPASDTTFADLPLASKPKRDSSGSPESKMVSLDDEKPIGSLLPTSSDDGVPTPPVEQKTPAAVPESKSEPKSDAPFELPPGTIDANVRLKQIDDDFRVMSSKPMAQWNLGSIRDQYLELRGYIEDEAFRRDVDKRLAAVGRYQANYNEFLVVQQIMRETEQRDEQIRQQFLQGRQSVAMQAPVSTQVTSSQPATVQPDPFAQPNQQLQRPAATVPQQFQPTPQQRSQTQQWPQTQPPQWPGRNVPPQWGATQSQNQRPQQQPGMTPMTAQVPNWPAWPGAPMPRKYDGAGIVQRSAMSKPGWPQYVLLAPDGRVLTYLQAGPGVDLERYVGQSMGFMGQRGFRTELNSDLLIVRQAAPVKLKN